MQLVVAMPVSFHGSRTDDHGGRIKQHLLKSFTSRFFSTLGVGIVDEWKIQFNQRAVPESFETFSFCFRTVQVFAFRSGTDTVPNKELQVPLDHRYSGKKQSIKYYVVRFSLQRFFTPTVRHVVVRKVWNWFSGMSSWVGCSLHRIVSKPHIRWVRLVQKWQSLVDVE